MAHGPPTPAIQLLFGFIFLFVGGVGFMIYQGPPSANVVGFVLLCLCLIDGALTLVIGLINHYAKGFGWDEPVIYGLDPAHRALKDENSKNAVPLPKCPNCGEVLGPDWNRCPCGYVIPKKPV